MLPENIHILAQGRLFVSVTDTKTNRNVILSNFNSKKSLVQVISCPHRAKLKYSSYDFIYLIYYYLKRVENFEVFCHPITLTFTSICIFIQTVAAGLNCELRWTNSGSSSYPKYQNIRNLKILKIRNFFLRNAFHFYHVIGYLGII